MRSATSLLLALLMLPAATAAAERTLRDVLVEAGLIAADASRSPLFTAPRDPGAFVCELEARRL